MKLTSENVETVLKDCLGSNLEGDTLVDGLINKFSFSAPKILARDEDIRSMLADLPEQFDAAKGGGWSFLNACQTRAGDQWTGLHRDMEALICLGIAANRAGWQMKEMADVLPGGVPYFYVNIAPKA